MILEFNGTLATLFVGGLFIGFAFGFLVGGLVFSIMVYFPNLKKYVSSLRWVYRHWNALKDEEDK